jgi:uncharacterized protein YqfA (UPF0365 family)
MEIAVFLVMMGLMFAGFFIMLYFTVGLYVAAISSNVSISAWSLIAMRLRGVNQASVIKPMIQAEKAGIKLNVNLLEAHLLAGGNVQLVVNALVSAVKAGIKLEFNTAAAIDLAGRNVFEAVQNSVKPKVIITPMIAAMAKDGVQVKATARITVRVNIDRLVGGAGEETILARVGEGICTTIGSAETHKAILENPDTISSKIMQKGLDANTAFEIISIDIADVDVGKNIGSQLQIDQADADKQVAQAEAEKRRAMAAAEQQENIALEQAMKAKVVEMQAKVVEAEARVKDAEASIPLAIAEALRNGNLGLMDYYKLANVEADTAMRKRFSKQDTK